MVFYIFLLLLSIVLTTHSEIIRYDDLPPAYNQPDSLQFNNNPVKSDNNRINLMQSSQSNSVDPYSGAPSYNPIEYSARKGFSLETDEYGTYRIGEMTTQGYETFYLESTTITSEKNDKTTEINNGYDISTHTPHIIIHDSEENATPSKQFSSSSSSEEENEKRKRPHSFFGSSESTVNNNDKDKKDDESDERPEDPSRTFRIDGTTIIPNQQQYQQIINKQNDQKFESTSTTINIVEETTQEYKESSEKKTEDSDDNPYGTNDNSNRNMLTTKLPESLLFTNDSYGNAGISQTPSKSSYQHTQTTREIVESSTSSPSNQQENTTKKVSNPDENLYSSAERNSLIEYNLKERTVGINADGYGEGDNLNNNLTIGAAKYEENNQYLTTPRPNSYDENGAPSVAPIDLYESSNTTTMSYKQPSNSNKEYSNTSESERSNNEKSDAAFNDTTKTSSGQSENLQSDSESDNSYHPNETFDKQTTLSSSQSLTNTYEESIENKSSITSKDPYQQANSTVTDIILSQQSNSSQSSNSEEEYNLIESSSSEPLSKISTNSYEEANSLPFVITVSPVDSSNQNKMTTVESESGELKDSIDENEYSQHGDPSSTVSSSTESLEETLNNEPYDKRNENKTPVNQSYDDSSPSEKMIQKTRSKSLDIKTSRDTSVGINEGRHSTQDTKTVNSFEKEATNSSSSSSTENLNEYEQSTANMKHFDSDELNQYEETATTVDTPTTEMNGYEEVETTIETSTVEKQNEYEGDATTTIATQSPNEPVEAKLSQNEEPKEKSTTIISIKIDAYADQKTSLSPEVTPYQKQKLEEKKSNISDSNNNEETTQRYTTGYNALNTEKNQQEEINDNGYNQAVITDTTNQKQQGIKQSNEEKPMDSTTKTSQYHEGTKEHETINSYVQSTSDAAMTTMRTSTKHPKKTRRKSTILSISSTVATTQFEGGKNDERNKINISNRNRKTSRIPKRQERIQRIEEKKINENDKKNMEDGIIQDILEQVMEESYEPNMVYTANSDERESLLRAHQEEINFLVSGLRIKSEGSDKNDNDSIRHSKGTSRNSHDEHILNELINSVIGRGKSKKGLHRGSGGFRHIAKTKILGKQAQKLTDHRYDFLHLKREVSKNVLNRIVFGLIRDLNRSNGKYSVQDNHIRRRRD